MAQKLFGTELLKRNVNRRFVATAAQARRSSSEVRGALRREIRIPELEAWFKKEASLRLACLPAGLPPEEKMEALEKANRHPEGSMRPVPLEDLLPMNKFLLSCEDVMNRAKQGIELLKKNRLIDELGTAVRGIPVGGASSRAAKWAGKNPEVAARFGITETTPRFLYRVGGRTLFQITLDFSQHLARSLGKIFPNIIMTNSEVVKALMRVVRNEWGNYRYAELQNTVFFNQIVLPRMWVRDQKIMEGQLYPAGHGDYPYLLAKYNMVKTLRDCGVRYLIFSNADEWLWQADPVMISIAQELFEKGHHLVMIGVENIDNQFGGGFVKKTDGTQSVVETFRLPWEIMKEGKAPRALNTSFFICDVACLADQESRLMEVKRSLVVKEAPGREPNSVEQVLGVDSSINEVLTEIFNPVFIRWPRLNFLGIKDGGFITGAKPNVHESVAVYPIIMSRLISGDRAVADFLFQTGYSYLG